MLIQLIYRSRSCAAWQTQALLTWTADFALRNQEQNIFGMLLYDGDYFMQVLEGQADVVDALYARIVVDTRHTDVVLLLRDPIPHTHFDRWHVGTLDMRDGCDSRLLSSSARWKHWCTTLGMQADQGHRATRIVEAFVRGRWRDPVPAVTWFSDAAQAVPAVPGSRSAVVSLAAHRSAGWQAEPQRLAGHDVLGETRAHFALQPIVHTRDQRISSVEALLRGPQGESPQSVLAGVPPEVMYSFDLYSKADAIALAASLRLDCTLSVNLLPNSLVSQTDAVDFLVAQCQRLHWPLNRLLVEVTEEEAITHIEAFRHAVQRLRASGIQVAIDDFGAGHAGLSLLAEFQPDTLKLDKRIIQNVHTSGPRQAIVRSIVEFCFCLGITVVAEGVERREEWQWLHSAGVRRFQGYWFARPGFQCVPAIAWPDELSALQRRRSAG
ncbi:MAG: hypothetical protein RLZZ352_2461 [Pseudomonadota bacterium]